MDLEKQTDPDKPSPIKKKRLVKPVKPTEDRDRVQLKNEMDSLSADLRQVKKENYSLQIEADSWEKVADTKSRELNKSKETLEMLEGQIWKQREVFCEKVDEFVDRYGLLSDWWREQMQLVSDPEQLKRKATAKGKIKFENKKNVEEIEKLRQEIKQLKEAVQEEEKVKMVCDAQIEQLESMKQMLLKEPSDSEEFNSIRTFTSAAQSQCTQLAVLMSDKEEEIQRIKLGRLNPEKFIQKKAASNSLYAVVEVNQVRKYAATRKIYSRRGADDKPFLQTLTEMNKKSAGPGNGAKEGKEQRAKKRREESSPRAKNSKKKENSSNDANDDLKTCAADSNKKHVLSTMSLQERKKRLESSFHKFLSDFNQELH